MTDATTTPANADNVPPFELADLQQRLNDANIQLGALISAINTLPTEHRSNIIKHIHRKASGQQMKFTDPLLRVLSTLAKQ